MGGYVRSGLPWITALSVAGTALACSSVASASTDYCVTCKGPEETYRCRVQGSEATPSDALKLYCVVRTAKEGGHASCSAKTAKNGCDGLVKVYTYEGPALPEGLTSDRRVRDLSRKIEEDRRRFGASSGDQPKSLFELGGRAVSASREGLRNAGSAIGIGSSSDNEAEPSETPLPEVLTPQVLPPETLPPDTAITDPAENTRQVAGSNEAESPGFARRSYNCVVSLFRDCSGSE